jgi:hypothetical protein
VAGSVDSILNQVKAEGALLRRTWFLFRRDAGALVFGTILIGLVSVPILWVFGLLAGGLIHYGLKTLGLAIVLIGTGVCVLPLIGGHMGIAIRRVRDQSSGKARQVFRGYRQFGDLSLASIVVFAGFALLVAVLWLALPRSLWPLSSPLLLVGLPVVYLFPAIVDERLHVGPALRRSVTLLRGAELWRTLAAAITYLLLAYVLGLPSSLTHGALKTLLDAASGVLWIFAFAPLSVVYLVCMYFHAQGEDQLVESAIAGDEIHRAVSVT